MRKRKIEKIIKNIEANKKLYKKIAEILYYDIDRFINDAQNYIEAIKNGSMLCNIDTISKSNMSCTIIFMACQKTKTIYNYRNFFVFFKALGYTPAAPRSNYFRISGGGMDMIFHTNYTNIHILHRLGFISEKECEHLAQQTPIVI